MTSIRLLALFVGFFHACAVAAGNEVETGKAAYANRCVVCHGAHGVGTERGPSLVENRYVRSASSEELARLIAEGVPEKGMPAFDLPQEKIEVLVAYVERLGAPAARQHVPGDPARGKELFFGKAGCASCHAVNGLGKAVGPDLSRIGLEQKLSQLEAALKSPGAHVREGYGVAKVHLVSGPSVRGFARNRSNEGLQLIDFDGRFFSIGHSQVVEIEEEKGSLMPPVEVSGKDFQDLIAYLSRRTGVKARPSRPEKTPPATEAKEFQRILSPELGAWTTYNGDYSGNRHSELKQIRAENVGKLAVRWMHTLPHLGLQTTPIVIDRMMFVTGPNQVTALDARTGREIWSYARPRTPDLTGDAAQGDNRGVAILGDRVFFVTDNAHLIALHRVTGALLWEVVMPEEKMFYSGTMAPLVVRDLVIGGVSGADEGILGFVAAYRASTGDLVWRRWTIPSPGEPGYETWQGEAVKRGGGSTWLTGTYDPEADILYWTTGNPFPQMDGSDRLGDNLYTACVLALNPKTGKILWHYQFTPHDLHDWDAVQTPVLIDREFRGRERKLLILANRNGFFYVLDRITGELLLAEPFVEKLTWASGIGPDGRPQLLPGGAIRPTKVSSYVPRCRGRQTGCRRPTIPTPACSM